MGPGHLEEAQRDQFVQQLQHVRAEHLRRDVGIFAAELRAQRVEARVPRQQLADPRAYGVEPKVRLGSRIEQNAAFGYRLEQHMGAGARQGSHGNRPHYFMRDWPPEACKTQAAIAVPGTITAEIAGAERPARRVCTRAIASLTAQGNRLAGLR
jgi:hypothetical protein